MTMPLGAIKYQRTRFPIKLELGDITLLEIEFDGVICYPNFLGEPDCAILEKPFRLLDEYGVKAVKIISLPVDRDVKTLRLGESALTYKTSSYNHHYVDTQVSFERYQDKFSSKTRSTLRRKVNKFFGSDTVNNYFRKFVSPDEIDRFFELAAPISTKTYQSRLFGRGLPLDEDFRREMKSKAHLGLVRGYLLYYSGLPVAYTFGPLTEEGVFLFDYNGYDPDYSKLSPGNVLQFKIIEDLCGDDKVRIYDLCIGESEHKSLFSTGSTRCIDVLILRASITNMLIIFGHLGVTWISRMTGIILARLNLKDRIKKLIRANVGTSAGQCLIL